MGSMKDLVLVVDTNVFIHELDVIKNFINSHIKGAYLLLANMEATCSVYFTYYFFCSCKITICLSCVIIIHSIKFEAIELAYYIYVADIYYGKVEWFFYLF